MIRRGLRVGCRWSSNFHGYLAPNDDVPIIKRSQDVDTDGQSVVEETRESRFDLATLEGKSPSPGMLYLPDDLADTVQTFTKHWDPQYLRQKVSALYKGLANGQAHTFAQESIDVETNILGTFLQSYASISNALLEVQKRLKDFNPKRILDVGYGPGTGVLAASAIFPSLERKVAVIFGHPRMERRAKQLLRVLEEDLLEEQHTNIKDEMPGANSVLDYDLIISTHQLYHSGPDGKDIVDSHAQRLINLLSPGGVLLFVERGDPLGFESIARARQVLIRPENQSQQPSKWALRKTPAPESAIFGVRVVAPCVHHKQCPLQVGLENRQAMKNPASANWCRFNQNVHRPRFTMELKKGQYLSQPWDPSVDEEYGRGRGGKALAGKGRPFGSANESATFSYLAIERATKVCEDEPAPEAPGPRILKHPLKRHKHVLMEVCAPSGNIEHWTVARSQGKQAYHDARKANGGDIWMLGAKSVQQRGGLKKSGKSDLELEENGTKPVDVWNVKKESIEEVDEPSLVDALSQFDPETELASGDIQTGRADKVMSKRKQKRFSKKWNRA
ncbi:37S ribosomal protein S22, mitochondrial [Wickerhamiella sorbophila]|uniref:37S ribosomal protein S22, mitochondrial n=1 Tax=Wickerhamiella sorbophila TaxID=45607 RepID=A0A2T0FKS5_9ASCO|nr:37S ribosomal protein S22, mitochondrial [Wickerhamiella sorbophila]PRT55579.1 37S ribosomal protein S22, mitochondrial [Wickerhamiella sorbophila]